jgi:hypothetical protein
MDTFCYRNCWNVQRDSYGRGFDVRDRLDWCVGVVYSLLRGSLSFRAIIPRAKGRPLSVEAHKVGKRGGHGVAHKANTMGDAGHYENH